VREIRNAYSILEGKSLGKHLLGKAGNWKDYIKLDLGKGSRLPRMTTEYPE
jgi:hypothetical protein